MGQRHVPPSQVIQHPKGIQTTIHGMTPLYANQRGDLSGFVCIFYVLRSGSQSKSIRVLINHAVDDVNLLEEQAYRVLVLVGTGNVR